MASATFNPSITKDDRKGHQALDKAKEAGADTLDKIKEAGTEALDKAKDIGADALGKVKEAGADVLGKAQQAAASVGEMAVQTAAAAGKKADDLTAAAGHEVKAFGDNLGKKMPHEGVAGKASQFVADSIKEGGSYIEEHKLSGMAHDVEQIIKNHPVPAVLICLGIGFCIGRAMKD